MRVVRRAAWRSSARATIRAQRAAIGIPAAAQTWGKRLISVNPGIVFTSERNTRSPSARKSTRAKPSAPMSA